MIQNTRFYSKKIGELTEGCRRCVKGEKLVLFVTGVCPRRCYFCPLSDEKYNKDVIFANERKIKNEKQVEDIMLEAKLSSATGAGITGGEPLAKIERTVKFIKALKKEFKRFHIHLYTSLNLVDNEKLRALYLAGLDEIRFHPDLDNQELWSRINLSLKYNWRIGVEIPVIPKKEMQTKKLIEFIAGKVHFLNLNELEMADNKINTLAKLGYHTKDSLSYAIDGSEALAKTLMQYISENRLKLNVHYCTAKLKDKVQLGNRIKLRAKNVKKDFDIVTDEGLLVRGVIYTKGFEPDVGYSRKIKSKLNKKNITHIINSAKKIRKDFKIKESMLVADEKKLRILTSVKNAKRLSKKIKNKCAVVTEYPTEDSFDVEIDFLN